MEDTGLSCKPFTPAAAAATTTTTTSIFKNIKPWKRVNTHCPQPFSHEALVNIYGEACAVRQKKFFRDKRLLTTLREKGFSVASATPLSFRVINSQHTQITPNNQQR